MTRGEYPSTDGGGPETSTVKFVYHNKQAPIPSTPGLLGHLSRASGHSQHEVGADLRPRGREGQGIVTFHFRNSSVNQIISQEDVVLSTETTSSEGTPEKPTHLNLGLSLDVGSSANLLCSIPSRVNRLGNLSDYEIFHQLSRESMPRVVSYRPHVDTESGLRRYHEVATTPSRGDIATTIKQLPRSSMIESLDLDHR
jgi:hypothetical protein